MNMEKDSFRSFCKFKRQVMLVPVCLKSLLITFYPPIGIDHKYPLSAAIQENESTLAPFRKSANFCTFQVPWCRWTRPWCAVSRFWNLLTRRNSPMAASTAAARWQKWTKNKLSLPTPEVNNSNQPQQQQQLQHAMMQTSKHQTLKLLSRFRWPLQGAPPSRKQRRNDGAHKLWEWRREGLKVVTREFYPICMFVKMCI